MGAIVLWAAEQETKFRQLYTTIVDGAYLSHRTIGSLLGKSRNAIIGKAHRLKLKRDPLISIRGVDNSVAPSPTQKEVKVSSVQLYGRRGPSKPPRALPVRVEEVIGPSPYAVSIVEVTAVECHFPMGHVGEEGFHLCGGPVTVDHFGKDSPYCAFHHKMCCYPPKPRDRYYAMR